MPRSPKVKYSITQKVDKLVVTDMTGEYDVTSNPGGYGDPNEDLNTLAVWAAVFLKHSTGDILFEPVTTYALFDDSADNTKQTTRDFLFKNDGVIDVYIGTLPVSPDGVVYLNGDAIQLDGFFYRNTEGGPFWKKTINGNIGYATPEILIGDDSVVQALCSDITLPRLAKEKQRVYKEYRKLKGTSCEGKDEVLWRQLLELSQDIQGAYYAFYSNLKIEAQDQVESMLSQYNLENQ